MGIRFCIDDRGSDVRSYFVAELSVGRNQSFDQAVRIVHVAKEGAPMP
jgi:sialic acid synthase SpsE